MISSSSKGPPTGIKGIDEIVRSAVQHHCVEIALQQHLTSGKVSSVLSCWAVSYLNI